MKWIGVVNERIGGLPKAGIFSRNQFVVCVSLCFRVRKRVCKALVWIGVRLKLDGACGGVARVMVKNWIYTIIYLMQRKIPALPRGGLKQSIHARKYW